MDGWTDGWDPPSPPSPSCGKLGFPSGVAKKVAGDERRVQWLVPKDHRRQLGTARGPLGLLVMCSRRAVPLGRRQRQARCKAESIQDGLPGTPGLAGWHHDEASRRRPARIKVRREAFKGRAMHTSSSQQTSPTAAGAMAAHQDDHVNGRAGSLKGRRRDGVSLARPEQSWLSRHLSPRPS